MFNLSHKYIAIACISLVVTNSNLYAAEASDQQEIKVPGFYTEYFHILPSVQLTGYYDDNIYATKKDTVSDTVLAVSPVLTVKSLWEKNELNLDTGANFGRYQDHDTEDYDDYWIKIDGKYHLNDRSNLFAGAGYSAQHEGRGSKDSAQTQEELTTYDATTFHAGYRQLFKSQSIRIGLTYEALDFDNVGNLYNDDRDRKTIGIGLQWNKPLSKTRELYVQALYNDRNYIDNQDIYGFKKDSSGYGVDLGVVQQLTNKSKLKAYIGMLQQEYDDKRFDQVQTPDYGVELQWYASQDTKVDLEVQRSIKETTEAGASGYIYTDLYFGIDQKLATNLKGYANLGYGNADYQQISRKDTNNSLTLGVKYFYSPKIRMTASYSYYSNDSNDKSATLLPGDSYDFESNLFAASITIRLAP